MALFVGTSGWQYRHWKDAFYPATVRQADWLEYYAERFQIVEVNNAFYRLPEAHVFAAWAKRTPADFVVGVKASRYITHIKRLHEPVDAVARFLERARHLEDKLGPILLQLPPNLTAELDDLDKTLSKFPADVRVAVEFRHDSWFTEETYSLLREKGAAFCLADSPRRQTPVVRTADWGYLRLHGGRASPKPCYSSQALSSWARRLAEVWRASEDVYVFFNNDPRACALRDAIVFARLAERAGWEPTRVPVASDVSLG